MKLLIETKRLYLRELSGDDSAALARVLCDPDSMRYYPRPLTAPEVDAWIQKNIRRYGIFGYGLWGVVLRENDTLIGDCGLTIQNIDGEMLPEIGFHVNPDYGRNGYATEAGIAALSYAHAEFKMRKVFSYCTKENSPSQKTMRKIGMEYRKNYFAGEKEMIVFAKDLR